MTECVLCDWVYDPFGAPLAAYLPGGWFPLRWYPDGPGPVWANETINPESTARVACVAHWATDHPEQLELALGEPFEMRMLGTPPGSPPVDTVIGIDLAKNGEATVVKAHKVWVAPVDSDISDVPAWTDVGSLITPLEFRFKHGFEE